MEQTLYLAEFEYDFDGNVDGYKGIFSLDADVEEENAFHFIADAISIRSGIDLDDVKELLSVERFVPKYIEL